MNAEYSVLNQWKVFCRIMVGGESGRRVGGGRRGWFFSNVCFYDWGRHEKNISCPICIQLAYIKDDNGEERSRLLKMNVARMEKSHAAMFVKSKSFFVTGISQREKFIPFEPQSKLLIEKIPPYNTYTYMRFIRIYSLFYLLYVT